MEQTYESPAGVGRQQPSDSSGENQSSNSSKSKGVGQASQSVAKGTPGKILSTGVLLMAILLSLLLGLSFVVRSLKNVKLILRLKLKRDDKAEKKY